MLETKEIEVILSGSNIRHYEDLNYEIPRIKDDHYRLIVPKGTKIIVKVKDLPKGSNIMVDVKCDYCGKQFLRNIINILNKKKIL